MRKKGSLPVKGKILNTIYRITLSWRLIIKSGINVIKNVRLVNRKYYG
jgi:hypothetical protein